MREMFPVVIAGLVVRDRISLHDSHGLVPDVFQATKSAIDHLQEFKSQDDEHRMSRRKGKGVREMKRCVSVFTDGKNFALGKVCGECVVFEVDSRGAGSQAIVGCRSGEGDLSRGDEGRDVDSQRARGAVDRSRKVRADNRREVCSFVQLKALEQGEVAIAGTPPTARMLCIALDDLHHPAGQPGGYPFVWLLFKEWSKRPAKEFRRQRGRPELCDVLPRAGEHGLGHDPLATHPALPAHEVLALLSLVVRKSADEACEQLGVCLPCHQ